MKVIIQALPASAFRLRHGWRVDAMPTIADPLRDSAVRVMSGAAKVAYRGCHVGIDLTPHSDGQDQGGLAYVGALNGWAPTRTRFVGSKFTARITPRSILDTAPPTITGRRDGTGWSARPGNMPGLACDSARLPKPLLKSRTDRPPHALSNTIHYRFSRAWEPAKCCISAKVTTPGSRSQKIVTIENSSGSRQADYI